MNCVKCNMVLVYDEHEAAHKCNGTTLRCGQCKKWMDIAHNDDHSCGEKQFEAFKEFYIGDSHRWSIQKVESK